MYDEIRDFKFLPFFSELRVSSERFERGKPKSITLKITSQSDRSLRFARCSKNIARFLFVIA